MIDCIIFTCPFLSLLVGVGGACENCCLWSSLSFASALWLLCRYASYIALSKSCHCDRRRRSEYGGGCRSGGNSDRGRGGASSRPAQSAGERAGEFVADGDMVTLTERPSIRSFAVS